jgi:hypothetical protein
VDIIPILRRMYVCWRSELRNTEFLTKAQGKREVGNPRRRYKESINKRFREELISYFLLMRLGPYRKRKRGDTQKARRSLKPSNKS